MGCCRRSGTQTPTSHFRHGFGCRVAGVRVIVSDVFFYFFYYQVALGLIELRVSESRVRADSLPAFT